MLVGDSVASSIGRGKSEQAKFAKLKSKLVNRRNDVAQMEKLRKLLRKNNCAARLVYSIA